MLVLQVGAPVRSAGIVGTLLDGMILSLAVGVVGMILLVTSARRVGSVALSESLATPAAICLQAAALIHVAEAPRHFMEYPPFGVAFVLLAVVQAAMGVAYLRRQGGAGPDATSQLVNAAILGIWAWSRAIGLPIGPDANQSESIGGSDSPRAPSKAP